MEVVQLKYVLGLKENRLELRLVVPCLRSRGSTHMRDMIGSFSGNRWIYLSIKREYQVRIYHILILFRTFMYFR